MCSMGTTEAAVHAGYLDPSHPSHPVSLTNACAATFSLQGLYSPEACPTLQTEGQQGMCKPSRMPNTGL